MNNNFITNYKELTNRLKDMINKYKLSNMIIQNKLYIIINKLYCETNLYILKVILFNLGFSNYKLIYEEDLYKNMSESILSIWKYNGIYLENNTCYYIDLNDKKSINNIKKNTLLITSNNEIKDIIDKELIFYENTTDPIFKLTMEYL